MHYRESVGTRDDPRGLALVSLADNKQAALEPDAPVGLALQGHLGIAVITPTRDIADAVGITERAAQRIVADLTESGYVETTRIGRRNHYTVNGDVAMRHPAQHNHEIGALLELLKLDDEETPE